MAASTSRRANANGKRHFPHQSTADQFFDEAQFESYRALGAHVARRAEEPLRRAFSSAPEAPQRVPRVA